MYYDAHTHLNAQELFGNREVFLDEFIEKGGKGLINIGVDNYYNRKAIEIVEKVHNTQKYKNIFVKAAIGLHPGEVGIKNIKEDNREEKITELKNLYKNNKDHIVAIGEIGIDTYYPGTEETITLQKKLFAEQCNRARELQLPIVIHSRANFEETMNVLQNYTDLTIYFHCRGYGPKEIEKVMELLPNLYIGFCGNITYPKAQALRDSLQKLTNNGKKLDQLLIETDAPYLTPQEVRKEKNKPSFIVYTYKFIAGLLEREDKDLQNHIEKNFTTLYKSNK